MSRLRGVDVRKAEQLILQEALLRGAVMRMVPSKEFRDDLKQRLAHGAYYEPAEPSACRATKEANGFLARLAAFAARLRLPSLAKLGSVCAVCIVPLLFVFAINPMMEHDTSLSAVAAEIQNSIGSNQNIHYKVLETYANTRTGYRSAVLWKVWKAAGGYAYVERCDGDRPDVRLSRYYYSKTQAVYIDDSNQTVRLTNYHSKVDEAERKVQERLVAPVGVGTDLPVAASFTRNLVTLHNKGKQLVDGRICTVYDSDGLKAWVDKSGLGYLRVEDWTGATFDPDVAVGATGDVVHVIEVEGIAKDDVVPNAIFVANPPDSYRRLETRDVYDSLALPKISLCFTPNIPTKLWETFEKPKSYTVITGAGDSRLEVVLFRKGQYKDAYSALLLTQYRERPYMSPINGLVNNADTLPTARPDGHGGLVYSWVSGATHFDVSVRNPGEHTGPDMSAIYQAVQERAQYLPRI